MVQEIRHILCKEGGTCLAFCLAYVIGVTCRLRVLQAKAT
jgi:hypothetical protein